MMVLPPSSSVLWRESVTVICSITSFSNKSGRFGVHASIMYTRYRKDKWQKEKWIASREGSFSSGSFPSSCECSLLTLLAPSSASIPFPAAISRGNSPNSVFLHLQNITFIIRQCFFPVSPTYLGAVSRSISPAGSHSQGMGVWWALITGRATWAPGCQGYPNHGWGRKRRVSQNAQSAMCPLEGHTPEVRGLIKAPSPGSSAPISLITPKYMNIVICVLKHAGVQPLQK